MFVRLVRKLMVDSDGRNRVECVVGNACGTFGSLLAMSNIGAAADEFEFQPYVCFSLDRGVLSPDLRAGSDKHSGFQT